MQRDFNHFLRKTQKVAWNPWNLRGTRYELRQEQPLGTDAENNWFSMQSALKVRVEREKRKARKGRLGSSEESRGIEIQ